MMPIRIVSSFYCRGENLSSRGYISGQKLSKRRKFALKIASTATWLIIVIIQWFYVFFISGEKEAIAGEHEHHKIYWNMYSFVSLLIQFKKKIVNVNFVLSGFVGLQP